MRLLAGLVLAAAILSGCGGAPATKGDVKDRLVAAEAERCAKQYLGKPNSGPNSEIWIMCAQVSASLERHDPVRVARQVIRQQGWNVFEFESRAGSTAELSAAGIARLASGE